MWGRSKKQLRPYDEPRPSIAETPLLVGAKEIVVYLHIAKTGGTSLVRSMEKSRTWEKLDYWVSTKPLPRVCECGDALCREQGIRFDEAEAMLYGSGDDARVFVSCEHVPFQSALDVARNLDPLMTRTRIIATVRPARARLISVFRHYWEQVELQRELVKAPKRSMMSSYRDFRHYRRGLDAYLSDSRHYRDPDGTIHGREWFSAFEKYRGGIEFFLSQIFGTPERLAEAIDSGQIEMIPTGSLDEKIRAMSGAVVPRQRVSRPMSLQMQAALAESSDIIDRLAAGEAPFDAVLRERLGDAFL